MPRRWVIDASPLIILGKLGQLGLLQELAESVVIPSGVAQETLAGPADDAARLWLESDGADLVRRIRRVDPLVAAWDLGQGETAVISFARQHREYEAVLDDAAARSCARSLGVRIRGTLSVIVAAKQAGLIETASALLDQMVAAGLHVQPSLLQQAKDLAGE